jgi:hypothetical protein
LLGAGMAVLLAAGCDERGRSTELNPEGPPRILQVFMTERIFTTGPSGNTITVTRENQLAFGDHPDIPDTDDREVSNAVARGNQRIRIVFDELLVGNYLEEIACANGSWAQVPLGATPDDIANCAGPQSVIRETCREPYLVCGLDGAGLPVGILDENEDKAPDAIRLQDNVVQITCDGTDIPVDRNRSFYQPSGNQLIPAGPGINGLGPALVVIPTNGMRTGSLCGITFGENVVDKDGIRTCTPPGGDINSNCTPGDTSLIEFRVEALALTAHNPPNNGTNVALTAPNQTYAQILTTFNAAIDDTSVTADTFVLYAGENVVDDATLLVSADDAAIVFVRVEGGFEPETEYELVIVGGPSGIADIFGGTLAQNVGFTFTTRAAGEMPDAGLPDAGDPDAGDPDAGIPDAML